MCRLHHREAIGRPAARGDNEIVLVGSDAYIVIGDRYGREQARAVIDAADVPLLAGRRWGFAGSPGKGYIRGKGGLGMVLLHRLLTGAPDGSEVDHVNGDRLDYRRSNLRIVTHAQNMQNRKSKSAAGHRNVYINRDGRYVVQLTAQGFRRYGGTFTALADAIDAARALRAQYYTHAVEARH